MTQQPLQPIVAKQRPGIAEMYFAVLERTGAPPVLDTHTFCTECGARIVPALADQGYTECPEPWHRLGAVQ